MNHKITLKDKIASTFYEIHKAIKEHKYNQIWLKGGRGSTKSSFVAIEIILGLLRDENANAIVFRRYQNELRDTVYGQVEWAINKLGLEGEFTCNVSPMQIVYKETGQKIVFKAADSPGKVKSINLGKGYIKYGWFEECDQFRNYSELRNIMQSLLRGEGNHKRTVFFTYNPPKSSKSWVNTEVKTLRDDRLVHHSTYLDVPPEWLGETFIEEAKHLERVNPDAYRHEYLGEETGTGLEIFNNVTVRRITEDEISYFDNIRQGIDFGYAVDPVAFVKIHYDKTRKRLYFFNEFGGIQISNKKLYENVKKHNSVMTTADGAEPKSIAELRSYGMKVKGAKKGPDSIEYGMKFLSEDIEEIIIDPERCPKVMSEFTSYALDTDRNGDPISKYPDKNNHYIDATRYALEDDMRNSRIKVIDKVKLGL